MNRIRQFREAQRLTQEALAKSAGVSRSYLAEMEKGSKTINSRRIKQVADALGVRDQDLFEEDDETAGAIGELAAILRRVPQRDIDLILAVARNADRLHGQAREQRTEAPPDTGQGEL